MNTIRGRAAVMMAAALAACSSIRPAPPAPAPAPAPAPEAESPPPAETNPPPPEPNPPPASSENPPLTSQSPPPAGAAAGAAPCVPPESNPKPKIKAKPKPAHNEAPPPQPGEPASAGMSPDGEVDAQVRPVPVPVMSILGKRVRGPKGEDLGRVVDVLADAGGRVRIAIVDFGGFLGVGDRRIAVDWPLLHFDPGKGDLPLLLSVGLDKLKTAPEYKNTSRPQTLTEPAVPADDKK
ncbi:MAG: PRC-barrel domain-containing protein [Steroidobacteraceae bacterium]